MSHVPCAIIIEGIEVFAYHGVLPEERSQGQVFMIDVRLELSSPVEDDALGSTIDYARVARDVTALATGSSYDLIETLAGVIADGLLADAKVRRAVVTVRKPQAPMPVKVGCVGVTVTRERTGSRGYLTGEDGA